MQTIIADSSSLIYLSKVNLLCSYSQLVRLIISPQVSEECTDRLWSEDARQIQSLIEEKRITVRPIPQINQLYLPHLGAGKKVPLSSITH